jgi:hypothetical protein
MDLMNEISKMRMNELPVQGLKNVASFIEFFSETSPKIMNQYFAIILPQLDSSAHQIRSAIIQAMGFMVKSIHMEFSSKETDDKINLDSAVSNINNNTSNNNNNSNNINNNEDDNNNININNNNSTNNKEVNLVQLARLRDSVLTMLIERVHDINPFTRATGLKVWKFLLENNSVPVRYIGKVAEIALDRLHDKNAIVRKNACSLMSCVIDNNPFSSDLNSEIFKIQIEELKSLYKQRIADLKILHNFNVDVAIEKIVIANGDDNDDNNNNNIEMKIDEISDTINNINLTTTTSNKNNTKNKKNKQQKNNNNNVNNEAEINDNNNNNNPTTTTTDEEFEKLNEIQEDSVLKNLNKKLEYSQSAYEVAIAVSNSVLIIENMLKSKTLGDVIESLRFFMRAINFNIKNSINAFQRFFFF